MIEGLGQPKPVRMDRTDAVSRTAAAPRTAAKGTGSTENPAARLAAEGAPVDSAKVERLRAAIADGSYTVDADRIADRMIEDWQG